MAETKYEKNRREKQAAQARKKKKRIMRKVAKAGLGLGVALIVILLLVILIKSLSTEKYVRAAVPTLHVNLDGSITLEEMGLLDEPVKTRKIKKELLKDLKEYNEKSGSNISIDEIEVDKAGNVYLRTSYSNAKEYSDYSGYECFSGTVGDALSAGYPFSSTFMLVTGKVKASAIDIDSVMSGTMDKVVIVRENITVTVPGSIVYVSDLSTQMSGEDTVFISQRDGNRDATDLVYIIYK